MKDSYLNRMVSDFHLASTSLIVKRLCVFGHNKPLETFLTHSFLSSEGEKFSGDSRSVIDHHLYKDGTRILENRKNTRIRMQGRSLSISRATESDAGEYMCVIEMAGLSFPFADHLGSRVKVTYPARVEKFPPQIRPILNRYLNLECKVQGFPIPRISWFVDGFPIEEFRLNNTRYGSTDNSDGLPNAIFFIRDVQYSDNREISCTTDNIDGSDQTTVNLEVRGETFFF
ncbi:ig-like domain-containing protein [Caerostris extrusa]|uniref:Ig-like domain-containing protein n=1 Tax=Caerostris extrusa TaxID=172846 RepID=A0AAV4TIJ4_CAEEX|nr:ig-like domain-containing protein [Caerostris extrusa]